MDQFVNRNHTQIPLTTRKISSTSVQPLSCCTCSGSAISSVKSGLPLICLVPRDHANQMNQGGSSRKLRPQPAGTTSDSELQLLDEDYIKKHFKLPQRSLYLDPFRRPLITFPMTQEDAKNFNLARKYKINQQILDGFLDPSEAISAPSVFPYTKTQSERAKEVDDDEELIYILQLPDWEFKCQEHNQTIKTPRFIWHSCKKTKNKKSGELKRGGGPLNKPKPWLLSRHTDFDLLSQPLARPGFDTLGMAAPVLVQMNPEGKWENCKPANMDEERLKAVVQHLVNSEAVSAVQSYCCQCAADNQLHTEDNSHYVPVIMMPIFPANECPFDMECEIKKIKQADSKLTRKTKTEAKEQEKEDDKDKDRKKNRRGFVMQRLTDFDLLSQW